MVETASLIQAGLNGEPLTNEQIAEIPHLVDAIVTLASGKDNNSSQYQHPIFTGGDRSIGMVDLDTVASGVMDGQKYMRTCMN